MDSPELRPCPFCAHPMPTSIGIGRERVERTAIFCPQCGAMGPSASAAESPWQAELLWNHRVGRRTRIRAGPILR